MGRGARAALVDAVTACSGASSLPGRIAFLRAYISTRLFDRFTTSRLKPVAPDTNPTPTSSAAPHARCMDNESNRCHTRAHPPV